MLKDFPGETGRNSNLFLFFTSWDEGGPLGKLWVTQGAHVFPTTDAGCSRITWVGDSPAAR